MRVKIRDTTVEGRMKGHREGISQGFRLSILMKISILLPISKKRACFELLFRLKLATCIE